MKISRLFLPTIVLAGVLLEGCAGGVCYPGYECKYETRPVSAQASAPLPAPAPQAQAPVAAPTPAPQAAPPARAPEAAPPAPAPRAQAGQRATARVAGMDLVEVMPGQYCPVNTVDARTPGRIWGAESAGTHPYANTYEKAVNGFIGPTSSIKEKGLELIGTQDYGTRNFKEGDVFCEMWWSSNKKDYRMNAGRVGPWVNKSGVDTSYKAYVVDLGEYEVVFAEPAICGNWDYVIRKKGFPARAMSASPAPVAAPSISDPFGVLYFGIVWETIPPDLQKKVAEVMATENEETAAEAEGAVSRNYGSVFWDLLVGKKIIKAVPEPVSFMISHPGTGGSWVKAVATPNTQYPGRTYYRADVSRKVAAEGKSYHQAKDFGSKNCTQVYPVKGRAVATTVNAKEGAPSELALLARDPTKTGSRSWFIMSCPGLFPGS